MGARPAFGIETSDGVIMVSPEYNYGIYGVLKNSLDWASRPYGRSVLRGKPVLTMTASPPSPAACARSRK